MLGIGASGYSYADKLCIANSKFSGENNYESMWINKKERGASIDRNKKRKISILKAQIEENQ